MKKPMPLKVGQISLAQDENLKFAIEFRALLV